MNKNLDIKKIPNALRVESIKLGDLYPKLVLEVELTTPLSFIILESKAKNMLEKEGGDGHLEILCKPYEMHRSSNSSYIRFYTFLTPELYQSIETFRAGENIKICLNISRLCILKYEDTSTTTPVQEESVTSVVVGNIISNNLSIVSYYGDGLLITREQWSDKVLKPLGVSDRFIFEMPCKLPDIVLLNIEDAPLNELKDRIVRGIGLLRIATDEYNTTKDVEKTVGYVRQATDLLHNIQDRDALFSIYGSYLIEKSFTGSDNISEDIIKEMFRVIDSLFSISSKVPHETKQNGAMMEYRPKYEDADALLGIVSFVYYFLSQKFERWLRIANS